MLELEDVVPLALSLVLVLAAIGCRPEPAPAGAPAPTPYASVPAAPAPLPASRPSALVLDASGVHLAGEPSALVPLPADPARGADAAYKRQGPNDLYLVPLAAALAREKQAGRLALPLRVIVDPSTPYRFLLEVLFTAAQSEVSTFELREGSAEGRTFSFAPPSGSGASPAALDHPSLNLLALVVRDGIGLKASGGNVAPGCAGVGPGLAIPRKGAALDLESFSACVEKLRGANPAYLAEDQATLVGNPDTPFRELMDVALALQGPSRQRFPKLQLGVPR